MTRKSDDGKHDVCTACGANLDYGEKCDCEEERQQDKPVDQKTA
ncbi:hypothetical protein [Anaerotignum sp.]|nr:hypothetical protein [Anaerotignum sp.]